MIFVTMLSTILVLTLTVVHAAPPPIDCGYRRCAKPDCPGGNSYTPVGSCCPVCGQDCRLVRCASPICPKGQESQKPPGKCCEQCRPIEIDCNLVDCRPPICPDSEELYQHDGECCQRCRPIDCSRVSCALPKCLDGQKLFTPPGKCCGTCRYIKKDCVHTDRKKYKNGESFKDKCNTCTCNDGQISCTEIGCLEKEGTCPKPWVSVSCSSDINMCDDDWVCPGKQKCCSNGCGGTVCRIPRRKCHNVICLACVGYTPPGACCPICGTGYLLGSAGDPPQSA